MAKKIKELGTYDIDVKTILEKYDIDRNGINELIRNKGLRAKYTGQNLYMQTEQLDRHLKLKPIEKPEVVEEPVVTETVIKEQSLVDTDDLKLEEVVVEPT